MNIVFSLKQIREQMGLTTAEAANLSGISQSYYSLIENGTRGNPLNVDIAKKIAFRLTCRKRLQTSCARST